jgi:predicted enzyme related to lactoylglutathione lyase
MSVQPLLLTADPDRLVAYYCTVFGAVETERMPADGKPFFIGLRLGSSELGVVGDDPGAGPDAPQRVLLSIEVADVQAAVEKVPGAGGRLTGGPTDMDWGQRVAHTTDPDGNLVNITQPIPPKAS